MKTLLILLIIVVIIMAVLAFSIDNETAEAKQPGWSGTCKHNSLYITRNEIGYKVVCTRGISTDQEEDEELPPLRPTIPIVETVIPYP